MTILTKLAGLLRHIGEYIWSRCFCDWPYIWTWG